MNTYNTLLGSYEQRVYKNTHATVKRHIHHVENPTPAGVISVEAVRVGNTIHLAYLTTEVALQEPGIESADPNIQMNNNCTKNKLHFGRPQGRGEYKADGDESDECDAIPTTSRQPRPVTELKRFHLSSSDVEGNEFEDGKNADANKEEEELQVDDGSTQNVGDWGHSWFDLGTRNVDRYECEHGDYADTDEEEEALQADDGSTKNAEDWGHSTGECEDWTVYFEHVIYDNGEATETAIDISEAKTGLQ